MCTRINIYATVIVRFVYVRRTRDAHDGVRLGGRRLASEHTHTLIYYACIYMYVRTGCAEALTSRRQGHGQNEAEPERTFIFILYIIVVT